VCCGFAGIVLLSWPKLSGAALDQGGLAGETALVGAAVCSAAGIVYARHRARDYSPLATSTGQITAGALWLLPLWLAQRPWAGPAPSWQAVRRLGIGCWAPGGLVLYYRLLGLGAGASR
jgi:drug/metabolite transporter (DMT)-like permease